MAAEQVNADKIRRGTDGDLFKNGDESKFGAGTRQNLELSSYSKSSGLDDAITSALYELMQLSYLPENPFTLMMPMLRRCEFRPRLFSASAAIEKKWVDDLIRGVGYGSYNHVS
jgi:hypothetical protein